MNFLLQSCFSSKSLHHTHFMKLGYCSISKRSVHLTLSNWCQNDSDLAMEFIIGAVINLSVKIQISHASATYYARHNSSYISLSISGKKFNSDCWWSLVCHKQIRLAQHTWFKTARVGEIRPVLITQYSISVVDGKCYILISRARNKFPYQWSTEGNLPKYCGFLCATKFTPEQSQYI
jgi:hypothetical protein